MKETLVRRINEMKKQTIGVEIEMAEITRHNAIKVIAKYFNTEDTIRYDGGCYDKYSCLDNKGRRWTITRDSSIRATRDDMRAELATPILKYDDIPDLQQIARELRHKGAKSNPTYGCGVHIHIGADGHTPKTIRNLVNIMASHEQIITDALLIDQGRIGGYCKMVEPKFLKKINEEKPDDMAKLADIWYKNNNGDYGRAAHYNNSRYHMLNLHALFTKGTIEFRLFQFDNPGTNLQGKRYRGGIHAGQLKSYIQLCLILSQTAKDIKTASPKPQQNENPKYTMRTWLLRLGFIGDEFKTARDVLTRNLTGDAARRNPAA